MPASLLIDAYPTATPDRVVLSLRTPDGDRLLIGASAASGSSVDGALATEAARQAFGPEWRAYASYHRTPFMTDGMLCHSLSVDRPISVPAGPAVRWHFDVVAQVPPSRPFSWATAEAVLDALGRAAFAT